MLLGPGTVLYRFDILVHTGPVLIEVKRVLDQGVCRLSATPHHTTPLGAARSF